MEALVAFQGVTGQRTPQKGTNVVGDQVTFQRVTGQRPPQSGTSVGGVLLTFQG